MDRRSLLKWLAVGAGGYCFSPVLLVADDAESDSGNPEPFSYEWLKGRARYLAGQPYESHEGELPDSLKAISWDDYQAISFRQDQALWAEQSLPFQVQLFHLGLFFQTPVRIHELRDGVARPLRYDPDYFRYEGDQPLGKLSEDLGFAGFRVHYHSNFELDLAAFLGASYFRAVGKEIQYGMSARGLAINTAGPDGEEFPRFAEYWLEKPTPGAKVLRVWALLDSPSVTGAYAFVLNPGANFVMDVDVALYPRKRIERLGIAPLTSMYQVGENSRRMGYDWRPEIHDSDGLLMHTGAGQWIWRPIVNPESLRYNSFVDRNPKGFGLLQRDRDFDHYQDDGVFYDRRPSLWVEPLAGWGAGSVDLVEIPTADETFDNIVAYWNPETALSPGQEYLFSYRLTWGEMSPLDGAKLATTKATRTGLGGVVGQPREYFSWRFVIDFAGGLLQMLADDAEVEPLITVSRGSVEISSARPLASLNGYRAMFDLVPDDSTDPIDLTLVLRLGDEVLTETWVYQYSPPPPKERKLY
ncbi:OpgD/OpgG family glucan biosynthesis protein [Marinobacter sp. F4206]|uniref:glucan biosynthesis protein n=1 Tax=Marinobacter sp. F4206 TaxID=2861777 RepID=UPI001C5F37F3|nr:glucan biosynthesis protein D [Marinobacter sp. F4206]MBW4933429.1 glucan biosynthesis protein [Marinobacter sp. F4206]